MAEPEPTTGTTETDTTETELSTAKQRPAWLVGLVIAVFVFVVILIVANLMGYGDDPAIGAVAIFFH